ncbi:MAG: hypothetical protein M1814_005286 [Vezdaea aestivalis]|nr:MAG: hypothetical protein M1814_005286 [Vezdaea aestivalis]
MSKIAIAGSGGLARCIAEQIRRETSYSFIILSRTKNEDLAAYLNCQVLDVDYNNPRALAFALQGIDYVISTILDRAQVNLIDAAAVAKVRRFVPSEFEGSPSLRSPQPTSERAYWKAASLEKLRNYSNDPRQGYQMQYTSFVCGIFYERFGPHGLSSRGIGQSTGIQHEGAFLMNLRAMNATIPYLYGATALPTVCMTAINDVAKFVVQSLEVEQWPQELHISGTRMNVSEVVQTAETLKGGPFQRQYEHSMSLAESQADPQNTYEFDRLQQYIDTAVGRYDTPDPNLLNSRILSDPDKNEKTPILLEELGSMTDLPACTDPWGIPPASSRRPWNYGDNEYQMRDFERLLVAPDEDLSKQSDLNKAGRLGYLVREALQQTAEDIGPVKHPQRPEILPNMLVDRRKLPPAFLENLRSWRTRGGFSIPPSLYDWYLNESTKQNPTGIPGYDAPSYLQEVLLYDTTHRTQFDLDAGLIKTGEDGWHMVRTLGQGAYGQISLWRKSVGGGSVYVAIKSTLNSGWFKDYPNETIVATRLQEAAFEFCPHGDLDDFIANQRQHDQPVPEAFIWHLFYSLAVVLTYCARGSLGERSRRHWEPLAHWDIKTNNILLADPDDSVNRHYPAIKLADWGFAYNEPRGELAQEFRKFKGSHNVHKVGTPGYQPPETEDDRGGRYVLSVTGAFKDIWTVGQTILRFIKRQASTHQYSIHLERLVLLTLLDDPGLRIKPHPLYLYTKAVTERFRDKMDELSGDMKENLFGNNSLVEYPGRIMFEAKYRQNGLMFGRKTRERIEIQFPELSNELKKVANQSSYPLSTRNLRPYSPPPLSSRPNSPTSQERPLQVPAESNVDMEAPLRDTYGASPLDRLYESDPIKSLNSLASGAHVQANRTRRTSAPRTLAQEDMDASPTSLPIEAHPKQAVPPPLRTKSGHLPAVPGAWSESWADE